MCMFTSSLVFNTPGSIVEMFTPALLLRFCFRAFLSDVFTNLQYTSAPLWPLEEQTCLLSGNV